MLAPGECSAWAIRSAATKSGSGGVVGQDDDLAGPGDAVDGHLAEDVPLGQGHEDVAGADDHVHGAQPVHAVGQRRHRLGAADAVDLADAQLMADGQQVGVVGAVRRRRHGRRRVSRDAGRLGRDDGHEQGRRIGGRSAGDHDADAAHRAIAQAQLVTAGDGEHRVAVQQAELERQHILAHPPHRLQEGGVGAGPGIRQFLGSDPQRRRRRASPGRTVRCSAGRRRGLSSAHRHRRARRRGPAAEFRRRPSG